MSDSNLTPEEREALEIALGKTEPKPWPSTPAEDLANDLQKFAAPCDEIDPESAIADPIRDHAPRVAPSKTVNRTLAILDELDSTDRQGETTAAECIHQLMKPSKRRFTT